MRLYSFFNSSTSYRVRIAAALKGVEYETVPINLRASAHLAPDFLGPINSAPGVPVLEVDGIRISQSLAIIDYLESRFPTPPLIPNETAARARVLSFAHLIACDIHPLNNLRVLRYLQNPLNLPEEVRSAWYVHWIAEGLSAVERVLTEAADHGGRYCFGDAPSLADCCLIPQVANALRMKCEVDAYPRVLEIYQHAISQPAFQSAAPERQPDFVA